MIPIKDVLSNSQELDDPILIVGCPRSGTGVVARTIGLSEQVCYVGETKVMPKYYTRRVPLKSAVQHWRNGEALLPILKGKVRQFQDRLTGEDPLIQIIESMIRYAKLRGYELRPPGKRIIDRYNIKLTQEDVEIARELHSKYSRFRANQVDRLLRILFKDFQLIAGRSKILEKTPMHAFYISSLKRIFPKAKMCFVLRDGRDVAASYLLNYGERKWDSRVMRYICRTHKRVRLTDDKFDKTGNPGYYRIKYEELVARPTVVMADVFKFLELPWSDHIRTALSDVKATPSKWRQLPAAKQRSVVSWLGLTINE
jgi:hypothetical protein